MCSFRLVSDSANGHSAQAFINGIDVSSVLRGMTVSARADSMITVDAEMLVRDGLDVTVSADVHLHATVPYGYVLVQKVSGNTKRITVELEGGR